MTATLHIGRRTTPHHPRTLRQRCTAFVLGHSSRASRWYFGRLHDRLPLTDPDRHALDTPAIEAAFAQLATDDPHAVISADSAQAARDADRETLLLATCDRWFREAHPSPEHRWSPATVAAYERLMDDVRACFHPGGAA